MLTRAPGELNFFVCHQEGVIVSRTGYVVRQGSLIDVIEPLRFSSMAVQGEGPNKFLFLFIYWSETYGCILLSEFEPNGILANLLLGRFDLFSVTQLNGVNDPDLNQAKQALEGTTVDRQLSSRGLLFLTKLKELQQTQVS